MKAKALFCMIVSVLLLSGCGDAALKTEESEPQRENSGTHTAIQLNNKSVTINEEGTYILSGSLENGSVCVDADKSSKLNLILDNVNIHSENSAAIYIKQADKVTITLSENSENRLSNGGSFESVDENNIDAVLFSKDDLHIEGSGRLVINSPAGHGIVSKDSLVIGGGSFHITAASHGLDCNEDIVIDNAELNLVCGKDGIHSENKDDSSLSLVCIKNGSFDISSEGDGISSENGLYIDGGIFSIVSGGGSENAVATSRQMPMGFPGRGPGFGGPGMAAPESFEEDEDDGVSSKGLKAAGELKITAGEFFIDAADDAVHSNMSVIIDGGNFDISTGDDAFHADDSLIINDGCIKVSESYEGLEALHVSVFGGDISVCASDDGLNAAGGTDQSGMGGRGQDRFGPPGQSMNSDGSIVINGGKLYVKADGDGIDANGTLEITGGDILVCTPTAGDTATMDYDVSATISGGSFIGTGAYGMAQTFGESSQAVVAASVGNCKAGTEIRLCDSAGKEILACTPELDFAVVIVSNSQLIKGESYTLFVGELSGEITAY